MEALIKYQIGANSGEVIVECDENDENEYLIAMAKRIVRKKWGVTLPLEYESWKVVKRF